MYHVVRLCEPRDQFVNVTQKSWSRGTDSVPSDVYPRSSIKSCVRMTLIWLGKTFFAKRPFLWREERQSPSLRFRCRSWFFFNSHRLSWSAGGLSRIKILSRFKFEESALRFGDKTPELELWVSIRHKGKFGINYSACRKIESVEITTSCMACSR